MTPSPLLISTCFLLCLGSLWWAGPARAEEPKEERPPAVVEAPKDLYRRDNLMAWCIVPFDARKRTPVERAAMLQELQIRQLAYDWREEHIPEFDAEVAAMQQAGIAITAWWFPGSLDPTAQTILKVIRSHQIHPQLWVMGSGEIPAGWTPKQMVDHQVEWIRPIAKAAEEAGCQVGLYNHGGWFGNPENQLEIIQALQSGGIRNVGIVFNFHHAHEYIKTFPTFLPKVLPHLLAVNLNGMVPEGDQRGQKILAPGEGTAEREMMRTLQKSGWQGPVGIIDHLPETDSLQTLRRNLTGLDWLRAELKQPGSGGPRPFPDAGASRTQ